MRKPTRCYGERVLNGLRRLFDVIHQRETMAESGFNSILVFWIKPATI